MNDFVEGFKMLQELCREYNIIIESSNVYCDGLTLDDVLGMTSRQRKITLDNSLTLFEYRLITYELAVSITTLDGALRRMCPEHPLFRNKEYNDSIETFREQKEKHRAMVKDLARVFSHQSLSFKNDT